MNLNKVDVDLDRFSQHALGIYKRLTEFYHNLNVVPLTPDVLPQAIMELGIASEMLQLATEKLYQQNEELIETRNFVETERQRHEDLFESAPDGYLVTDPQGTIREANRAAAKLFNIEKQYLVGEPMTHFVGLEERQHFHNFLIQLSRNDQVTELVVRCQKHKGESFDAASTVAVDRNQQGKPIAIRWLVRDMTERQIAELAFQKNKYDFSQNRPVYKHFKGETIPLNPLAIWYVNQGLVKLTTLCETGEEVLVGLAGSGIIFGSSMTDLSIYEATVLLDAELVSIHLAEIAVSPTLSHTLFPKISQRLKQAESFLVISSRQRIQDRLHHLLQLLAQEIGQPVEEGTRLSVRLTHEELASYCYTTRVTITRLMGKLRRQGKISFDQKNHIILKNL